MDTLTKESSKTRQKINGISLEEAKDLLRRVQFTVTPNNLSLRRTIKDLIPDIYLLHSLGFDFSQLAEFLGDCNIKIQVGTLKTYYYESITEKMELCNERMNEQLLILNEIKKVTKNAEVLTQSKELEAQAKRSGSIKNQVDHILAKQQKIEETKFAQVAVSAQKVSTPPAVQQPTATTKAKSKPEKIEQPLEDDFGLLTTPAPNKNVDINPFAVKPSIPFLAESPELENNNSPKTAAASPPVKLACGPLKSGVRQLARRADVPEEVYDDELVLEHPGIPGLLLNKDQRLYGAELEIIDEHGNKRLESMRHEKQFRIRWKSPVPVAAGLTSSNFTEMDESLFPRKI